MDPKIGDVLSGPDDSEHRVIAITWRPMEPEDATDEAPFDPDAFMAEVQLD